jgi:hypothetical protein
MVSIAQRFEGVVAIIQLRLQRSVFITTIFAGIAYSTISTADCSDPCSSQRVLPGLLIRPFQHFSNKRGFYGLGSKGSNTNVVA